MANYLLTFLGGMFCASMLATAEDDNHTQSSEPFTCRHSIASLSLMIPGFIV